MKTERQSVQSLSSLLTDCFQSIEVKMYLKLVLISFLVALLTVTTDARKLEFSLSFFVSNEANIMNRFSCIYTSFILFLNFFYNNNNNFIHLDFSIGIAYK